MKFLNKILKFLSKTLSPIQFSIGLLAMCFTGAQFFLAYIMYDSTYRNTLYQAQIDLSRSNTKLLVSQILTVTECVKRRNSGCAKKLNDIRAKIEDEGYIQNDMIIMPGDLTSLRYDVLLFFDEFSRVRSCANAEEFISTASDLINNLRRYFNASGYSSRTLISDNRTFEVMSGQEKMRGCKGLGPIESDTQ